MKVSSMIDWILDHVAGKVLGAIILTILACFLIIVAMIVPEVWAGVTSGTAFEVVTAVFVGSALLVAVPGVFVAATFIVREFMA